MQSVLQNMAGLQHCCRKLLICNTSRLINRNGILLQPNRRRHHLVFQISSPHNRMVFQKSRLLLNTDRHQLILRLASTNVNTPKEAVANTSETATAPNQPAPVNNEAGSVQSTNSSVVIDESSLPPAPTVEGSEIPVMEFVSTGLKEPSFQSLGLGSWWPSGIIQQFLEYLHINLDMPWWQAIITVTLLTRILMFPINLSVRRDTINLTNNLPKIMEYQRRITEARATGDYFAAATATQEFQSFMSEKKVNMLAFLKTAFIQGPVFLSMFYALKGMAKVPVESLKTGGLFWFTDLTSPDPYYLLPLLLSASLAAVIELGAEGNPAKANSHAVKWMMRGLPIIICLVSTRFSSCITWYWTISNLIVLGQAGLLRIPAAAKFFKLPKTIVHDPKVLQKSNKGFIEGFKEGFSNAKLSGQIEDRQRLNFVQFQKAGTGPIPRTFKKNPLLEKLKK